MQTCQLAQHYFRDDPWNPFGFGTMFESFPFPIFLSRDAEVEAEVVECFEKFNRPSDDSEPGMHYSIAKLHRA